MWESCGRKNAGMESVAGRIFLAHSVKGCIETSEHLLVLPKTSKFDPLHNGKVKLDHVGGDWVEELPNILWVYQTTPRESTGLIPFHLVYDSEVVIPIEVRVPSVRRMLYDQGNTKRRLAELDFIGEVRERATIRLTTYRQKMCQNYDRRVMPRFFGEEDLV
ncbi:uncharacterized protein LOC122023099 [Zingiber officinale]|uniref:uncharacterized protein LOC122023099 n=1 Tax=Zingiber officinale TaxID=94328 RepID=UPI001C4B46AF|nr:uncharacterized protein LOC122023099 [Zingiber officinale]